MGNYMRCHRGLQVDAHPTRNAGLQRHHAKVVDALPSRRWCFLWSLLLCSPTARTILLEADS